MNPLNPLNPLNAVTASGAAEPAGWIGELRRRLQAQERVALSAGSLIPAGVLVPLFVRDGELCTLFTRRNDRVEHHKGQISFPGGVRETEDADIVATALRESHEEIGLAPRDALVLGLLDDLATRTGFLVTPVVAAIPYPYEFTVSADEIDELFIVPYAALRQPDAYEERMLQRGEEMVPVKFYRYGDKLIWGITAQILWQLAQAL